MKRFVAAVGVVLVLGGIAVAGCRFRASRTVVVQQAYAAPVYEVPVVYPAVTYYPVQVPTYSMSYNFGYDQLRIEIMMLRAELAAKNGSANGNGTTTYGQPQPEMTAQPGKVETAPPPKQEPQWVGFLRQDCVKCHEAQQVPVQKSKLTLFVGNNLAVLSGDQKLEIMKRLRGHSEGKPQMPLNGKEYDDTRYSLVVNGLLEMGEQRSTPAPQQPNASKSIEGKP